MTNKDYMITFAWVHNWNTYYEKLDMSRGDNFSIILPGNSYMHEVVLKHEKFDVFGLRAGETSKTRCDCSGKEVTLSYIDSVLSVV